MTTAELKIHSENILPIIKRWLYSDRDIFARELVSNSCDAIHKLRILREQGQISFSDNELRIDVTIDADKKTLTFADTGLGMTADEVERYIAQIAFSGAEEFVEKYKTKNDDEQVIGHFGLGFYSSFMVASTVEVDTLSWQEGAEPAHWSCDGSHEYTLTKGSRSSRGTTITLHVGEEDTEFLEPSKLREVLARHCTYLPVPIYLNEDRINPKEPLWLRQPKDCTKEDYLEFYRGLYPMEEEPLFWVHLNVDYPFHLKGILYFPKMRRDLDPRRSTVQLYCNRVFVADNCKDILADYLTVLRGAIDSPDIPLNVSRNALQMDRTVRQLASHVSKKVADSLATLYRDERERYISCWSDIEVVMKLGAMEDPKFYERVKDLLIWKTTADEWMTTQEYLDRYKEKTGGKLFYLHHEDASPGILEIYRQQEIEALLVNRMLDPHLLSFLENKLTDTQFVRLDGSVDDVIINKEKEKTLLDADGKTEAAHIADFFRKNLSDRGVEVEAKSLASDSMPAFIMIDEQQRRMRDIMSVRSDMPDIAGLVKPTLVVNTNSHLINALRVLGEKESELSKELTEQLYDLSLLSQRELPPEQVNSYINRSQKLLDTLVSKLAEPKETS